MDYIYDEDDETGLGEISLPALIALRSVLLALLIPPCAGILVLLGLVLPSVAASVCIATALILCGVATLLGVFGFVSFVVLTFKSQGEE